MTLYKENSMKERVQKELQDNTVRKAVATASEGLKNRKLSASEEFGNWEEWRTRGSQIRSHTIQHLDYYLEQFVDNLEASGGKAYFASDATEAVDQVIQIIKSKNGKLAVKAKSMVTEEIQLNTALENEGVEVVETDLGEYIIQLANEHPSHLIGPSIHKTKEQVAELFSKLSNEDIPAVPEDLVAFARRMIREKFLQADIGITGCNFAIAESGAISIVTNEGNGRMVTTLPDTHIVLMGMERIVPTWDDFEVVLNLLTRSASGQKISTGVSVLKPMKEGDVDAPKEMHVIILDNGRSRQLHDPDFREILNCIRCGACINACPVYRQVGGHAYGSVYNGPIGAVLTPLLNEDSKAASELSFASSLCGACHEACPVKIPLHDMLVKLRERHVEKGYATPLEKLAFDVYSKTFSSPTLYSMATRTGSILQKPFVTDDGFKDNLPFIKNWTQSKAFPAVKKSFRERWNESGGKL